MHKLFILFLLLLVLPLPSVFSQTAKPDSAQFIIDNALAEIKSSDKNIMLVFHASWCVWCKWLDSALESSDVKPIIEKYYSVVRIDVKEFGEKVQLLENPGALKLLEEFGGDKSGLPFIAFLNKKGTMIANSNVMPKKQNIGYPGAKEEIAAFIELLKKTAPRMTRDQRAVISRYLEKNAPK